MKHLKLKILPALLIAASSLQAQAQLPTGMTVANGQATAQTNGKTLTVTNSANTILDWRSFSIGADSAVRFNQPSAASSVLNRVSGTDPSNILGSLSSNGRVWLLNPNGVLFGQGARVDVASLVTSTLNISNSDWLAGRNVFSGTGAGSIVNQGEIRSATGGRVALIASGVSNEGLISAPDGQVILAAGASVELVDTGAPNLAVKLTAPTGQAVNLGSLSAGRIDVMAAAVNQQGIVEAQSIVLQADGRLTLASGSRTSADGAQGGSVKLLGQTIDLQNGSAVSANGLNGGGTVLVGGGARGQDASVPNAQGVYFAPGASITADATVNGNGGNIVLWADQATRAYGSLSAHAGTQGGNGGLIETSGHWLDANPARIDLSAKAGKAGTWLLDPYDITISDGASDSNFDPSFTATGNNATINSSTIASALSAGTNVTISTGGGGAQSGDITMENANINVFSSMPVTLQLEADRDIVVKDSNISNGYGPLNVVLNSGKSGLGAIMLDDATISTYGGNLYLSGYGPSGSARGHAGMPDGVVLTRSSLSAGSGDITISGQTAETGGRGVALDPSVTTGNYLSGGFITINGTSTLGTGVQIRAAQLNANSMISVTGTGRGNGVELSYYGANFPVALSGFNIKLDGSSTGSNYGVLVNFAGAISGSPTFAASAAGGTALQIIGTNSSGGLEAVALLGSSQTAMFNVATAGIALNATGGGMLLGDVFTSGTTAGFNATSSSTLVFDNVYISTDSQKQIGLHAQDITLEGSTTLYAGATTGRALTINGPDNVGPAASFHNSAGSGAIMLDSGGGSNFTIYVNDATNGIAFDLGGVAYDYQRYGATTGPVAGDAGSGIISYASHTATLSGTVIARPYDGTTSANVYSLTVQPDVAGDYAFSSLSYTADYADKNAGTGKSVTVNMTLAPSFYDAGSHPVYGYTVPQGTLVGDITKATISGQVTAANKVYDGTTTASLSIGNVFGLVGSETLGMSATGNFDDKNVGTGKYVTGNVALSNGTNGGLASNYQFSVSEIMPADITPATITFAATAVNKVYDTTLNATLTNVGITPLGSDQLTLNAGSAMFSDKNVGTGKTVFLSGFSLGGADAGNYVLQNPANLTANITPFAISFTATTQNKVYDGTTATTLGNFAIGLLGSDQVTLNTGTAAFVDKNAGTAKSISATGFSLSGSDAGNYTLTVPTTLVADITPAQLRGVVTGTNKVYDGTTTATVGVSGLAGLVGSETVTVTGTGNFSDKNVGTAKPISATYQVGNGTNGGLASNYSFLPTASSITADITPATLTYMADAVLMQTGAPFPTFTGTITGFVSGDTAANSLSNAGSYQAGVSTSTAAGIYAINGTGASAQNYVFVQAASNATALTIAGGGPAEQQAQAAAVPINNVQPVSAPPSNPISTGIVDLTPAPLTSQGGGSASFESLPLGEMSQQQVANALGARATAMQAVLGGGLSQVKSNPAVADVVPCKSLKEAATGLCLVTAALKLEARNQGVQQAAVPTPAPAPGAAPAPTVAQAAVPIAPAPLAPLFASRRVKNAALPEIRRKLAVLIGESRYADKTIPSLGNAGSDAHAVAETLSGQLGYETLVLDNPSKEEIIATLNRLALETGEQDSVVIYYAGHGAQVDATGQGYWLPANADASQAKTWLSNADIARLVQQVGARQVALISDSCYSGALVGGAKIRGVSGTVNPAELLSRRAAVVMSSGGNEPVFDAGRGGHSLFAWSLMRNLEQVKGWQLGGNLFERVRFSVARELPQRPQYGTAQGSVEGGDYFFETRQLDLASL